MQTATAPAGTAAPTPPTVEQRKQRYRVSVYANDGRGAEISTFHLTDPATMGVLIDLAVRGWAAKGQPTRVIVMPEGL